MDQLRPKLIDFHGVSMTHIFTDNWDKVQNFKAKPDDIVVATYPKAGNLHTCFSCLVFLKKKNPLCFSVYIFLDKLLFFRHHLDLLHSWPTVFSSDMSWAWKICPYLWQSAIFRVDLPTLSYRSECLHQDILTISLLLHECHWHLAKQ